MNNVPTYFEAATGLPEYFAYIAIFAFGAAIGSFLNVVIHRVPRGESIVLPDSACPKCHAKIKPYDNIPLIGWLMLRGKCRACSAPISIRYPAVELLTGLVFVVVYWRFGFSPFLPVCEIFAAVIIALVFIDAEHMILPNVITYPLLVAAIIVRIAFPIFFGAEYFPDISQWPASAFHALPVWALSLIAALAGALVGGGSLWLVGEIWKRLRGVEAMGLGDVKMMFGVGALLGWRLAILAIFLGAFTGAIAGIIVISRQKDKDMQAMIPFGIFLGIGSLAALLFGNELIDWYLRSFIA